MYSKTQCDNSDIKAVIITKIKILLQGVEEM